jgi:hypothetical protein
MINLTHPDIAEIQNDNLPFPTLDVLKNLRTNACEASSSGFKLQSQQRFLRRVLSPDSPTQSVLVVHGTGSGKTCTAIQIAEEYIIRPEFQYQKVLVIASASVQASFAREIFDITRVDPGNLLQSKQCTGRRYLDMLLRVEQNPKNWEDPNKRDKLQRMANRIINDFYEFNAYATFGTMVNEMESDPKFIEWVHKNFDNRLVIIDEAHNIRLKNEENSNLREKAIVSALDKLVKIANNMILVLLTATPMYDIYDEIMYYFNLFLWNEKKQDPNKEIKTSDFFDNQANLLPGEPGQRFRDLCQTYVSYVKGDNPFTFPFRLTPAPVVDLAPNTVSYLNRPITDKDPKINYLKPYIVESIAQGEQNTILKKRRAGENIEDVALMQATIGILPGNSAFQDIFNSSSKTNTYYTYRNPELRFLSPANIQNYSAKFARIIKAIDEGEGVVFVYSNMARLGAQLFAMALEEHGYGPYQGKPLLIENSNTKGKYILLSTTNPQNLNITSMIDKAKDIRNKEGDIIRVIISSPVVAEGVNFRYVRQVHVIDPWWNMSRIEQVIGRGLRTCSHQVLPFEKQNCTVYLHTVRTNDGIECYDEYTYRIRVEPKAVRIAKVRKIIAESAMDCPIQKDINTLPPQWQNFEVTQNRSEGKVDTTNPIVKMMAPAFDSSPGVSQCVIRPSEEDNEYTRPLSTYIDVRDEILQKLGNLFIDKPIWDRDQLIKALKTYNKDVVIYNLQQIIQSGIRFKDAFGREAFLESKGDLYMITPIGLQNGTMIERIIKPAVYSSVELQKAEVPVISDTEISENILKDRREAFVFPSNAKTRFTEDILNGYIFDHMFSDEEKLSYLKKKPQPTTPSYVSRLYVKGTEYIVLGNEKYYPAEVPVGEDKTKFNQWTNELVQRFIDKKDTIYGSVNKDGKFTISKVTKDGNKIVPGYTKTSKNYSPTTCGTGSVQISTMREIATYVDAQGVGLPNDIKGTMMGCVYLELLMREQNNCFWLTPEELDVLFKNNENKKKFTKEFKK